MVSIFSPKNRRKAEVLLIAAGFFVAAFMAFHDEHIARVRAESALSQPLSGLTASQLEDFMNHLPTSPPAKGGLWNNGGTICLSGT
jgi:hypothetical protein